MGAFVLFAIVILVLVIFGAISERKSRERGGRDIKSGSFSDELYDYSIKSKGQLRNPHMSRRAMKHRMMKRR